MQLSRRIMELGEPESVEFCFAATRAIEINGRKKIPDGYRAYIDARLGGCLPMVVDQYAMSWHPSTIANSYQTLQDQVFNFRHQMAKYKRANPEEAPRHDSILGTVLEVEYPRVPSGGWKLPKPNADGMFDIPRIRAVMNLPKKAMGSDRILGTYQSGREDWSVSIETTWNEPDSGIVMMSPRGKDLPSLGPDLQKLCESCTPDDMAEQGYLYVPFMEAPETLLNSYDMNARMFTKPYKGRRTITLAGGIDGNVQFYGIGLVNRGAEPTAEIVEMLAEADRQNELERACVEIDRAVRKLAGLQDRVPEAARLPEKPLTRKLLEAMV